MLGSVASLLPYQASLGAFKSVCVAKDFVRGDQIQPTHPKDFYVSLLSCTELGCVVALRIETGLCTYLVCSLAYMVSKEMQCWW
jgi:hypothetical protein